MFRKMALACDWPADEMQARREEQLEAAQVAAWTELAAATTVGRGRESRQAEPGDLARERTILPTPGSGGRGRRSQPGVQEHSRMSRCVGDDGGFCWGHVGTLEVPTSSETRALSPAELMCRADVQS